MAVLTGPRSHSGRGIGGVDGPAAAAIRGVASTEYGRVVASVIGTVGDWTIAEDAVQDALARALVQWPLDGVPRNPAAWVTTVARRRAIDLLRHERAERRMRDRVEHEERIQDEGDNADFAFPRGDEQLQLIFTACHPALSIEARTALTLRTVLNVPVEQLATLFGVGTDAMQKRLVRARAKIKHAGIPYRVPDASQMAARSESVCEVLSALFTTDYAEPSGHTGAANEAIRLARLCCELLPLDTSERLELNGLLASMLMQHSRRAARTSPDGRSVPFGQQDRDLWRHEEAQEGLRLLDAELVRAARNGVSGGRQILRAAIAAEYARPAGADSIDHTRIASLHEVLERLDPSPFVTLNRVVALANAAQHDQALQLLETLTDALPGHHLCRAVRGDLLQRLGRDSEAEEAFRDAADAATSERERRSYLHEADRLAKEGAHAHH